jgi:NAD(P)-dependent dehydrogenase (short-subunit alcohol dehydrogenase family)
MPFLGLYGKVAIVTGAARGIGSATAHRLIKEGCKVVAVDIERKAVTDFVARLGTDAALPIDADVSTEAGCDRYVAGAVERFGAVHLFVNNAGIGGKTVALVDTPLEEFDRVYAVNVRGVFLGLRAVLRQMRAQASGGAIVNLSSVGALAAKPGRGVYQSAKRAVIGLSHAAAVENAAAGIRVNAIAPGYVNTDMTRTMAPAALADILQRVPVGRAGEADEIAAFIAYLLSDEASFQTGGLFTIDGGLTT